MKVVALASTEPLVESSEDLSISFCQTSGTHLKLTSFPKSKNLLKTWYILLWPFTPTSFYQTSGTWPKVDIISKICFWSPKSEHILQWPFTFFMFSWDLLITKLNYRIQIRDTSTDKVIIFVYKRIVVLNSFKSWSRTSSES